jgi:hypothetical protein
VEGFYERNEFLVVGSVGGFGFGGFARLGCGHGSVLSGGCIAGPGKQRHSGGAEVDPGEGGRRNDCRFHPEERRGL